MRRFADTMTWAEGGGFAIDAAVDQRMGFIRRTYGHLLAELLGVAVVTSITMSVPALLSLATSLLWSSFILYVGVFLGLSLLTRSMLAGEKPIGTQYLAAGLWVTALGFLCAPLVAWVGESQGFGPVWSAFLLTSFTFGGLTAYVLLTKKDFSFLGGALTMVTVAVVGFLIIGSLFGFTGGAFMTLFIVILLGGWVLYDTSQVLHRRHVNQYVAASVELLVDFVLMFINILSLLSRD